MSCPSMMVQDKIKLNNVVNRSGWCPRSTVVPKVLYPPPRGLRLTQSILRTEDVHIYLQAV